MAIYHAHIKNFSRGKGEAATAAAAYRAGIDILDTRTRIHHQYSRRHGVISYHMLAPAGAPVWCSDPTVFFDACEQWESRANSVVARELEVSLPHEMTPEQRLALALSLGQLLVDRYQVVVLAALHAPSDKGDERNFHVHLLMSSRQVGVDGFGVRAASELDARAGRGHKEVYAVRALVSETINHALASAKVLEKVDHRSLRTQAIAAHAAGDLKKAAELSRPPTQHIGKAITAALRRGSLDPLLQKVGIATTSPAQQAMAQAEAAFKAQGRLAATPLGHGPTAARLDRVREQAGATSEVVTPKTGRGPRGPSATALHLSRVARLGRAQGKGSDVLNSEAKVVEEWLASQQEAAKAALASLQSIAGLDLEPELRRAMETAGRRRVGVYGSKLFFFEDSEALTTSIVEYAAAIAHPHAVREKLRRAESKLSVESTPDGTAKSHARLVSAKRALAKAREAVSKSAQAASHRRIAEARAVMVACTEAIERDYYVTPLDRAETCPPHPYTAGVGGERQSNSNQVQLKPRETPRI
jgi:hypothetical protein